ncbi:hypothetical protein Tco_0859058 [Tanacetum coccineum]|uniref:Uncharacterized protein n=1 Tax=Tanacetum coccineum TaxID=301880 RepID=A0ABQ5BEL7_9ASTR
MLESKAYQTYYAFASGEKAPKLKYIRKKADSNTSPKKKHVQATKGTRLKSKAKSDDRDDDNDEERIESDRDEILDPNLTNLDDEEIVDDEEDDEVIKELYDDVNVNLGNDDTEMTDADQGASEQQNVSQESGFKQIEEDSHVTLTPVIDAQKADKPVQSSFVSSDFTSKLLNLENPSPDDNEIASLMETLDRHATAIPEITSGFTTTTPPPPPVSILESEMSKFRQTKQFFEAVFIISGIVDMYLASKMKEAVDVAVQLQTNKLKEEAQAENQEFLSKVDSTIKAIIKDQVKVQVSKIMPKIEKYVTESLGAEVLVRSTNQPQTSYAAAASLSEFKLNKILIDKIEANKSIDILDFQKNLYNALVESYNNDNDIMSSYGDVTEGRRKGNLEKMLSPLKIQGLRKRSLQAPPKTLPNLNISLLASLSMQRSLERINKKKDENTKPKRHNQTRMEKTEKDKAKSKAGKLIKSQKVKLKSSTVSSSPVQLVGDKRPGVKTTNQEPSHTVEESGMQQDQEFIIGDNVEQPADKDVTKADWFKKPERPPTLDPDWIRDHQLTFECC